MDGGTATTRRARDTPLYSNLNGASLPQTIQVMSDVLLVSTDRSQATLQFNAYLRIDLSCERYFRSCLVVSLQLRIIRRQVQVHRGGA